MTKAFLHCPFLGTGTLGVMLFRAGSHLLKCHEHGMIENLWI
ncbi:hypothetical protein Echvi_1155 [Echinicola vietnamensis DSM 17526]|uniref:Uncharacterized protein n=1 Tax=Echinicola vietnamensis (strain DSM 17526 / LMG 23754 / KMM 6221) TaxID=926556 RepID=L0FXE2_ECHVK|nr:hypothetical protein Echvi_1155 [Echinicola vietnamensis DSM 17526]